MKDITGSVHQLFDLSLLGYRLLFCNKYTGTGSLNLHYSRFQIKFEGSVESERITCRTENPDNYQPPLRSFWSLLARFISFTAHLLHGSFLFRKLVLIIPLYTQRGRQLRKQLAREHSLRTYQELFMLFKTSTTKIKYPVHSGKMHERVEHFCLIGEN